MSSIISSKSISSTVTRKKPYSDFNMTMGYHPGTKDIMPLTDLDAIKQAVKNIVLTGFGEKPFHPQFGSGVFNYMFENVMATTGLALEVDIQDSLKKHEPRVEKVSVDFIDESDNNRWFITINFSVKGATIPATVEFYLDRIR